jgi:competence protein ComEC
VSALVRYPPHLLAGAMCVGLALANVWRPGSAALVGAGLAACAIAVADTPLARFLLVALALCLLGWWWGSGRLAVLDRSPLHPEVGRAGRALVTVTAPPRRSRFAIRVQGRVTWFRDRRVDEAVQLELPVGRSPPQGGILKALVVVGAPRGPEDGFDERTWLRRHGIHVVLHADEWRLVGRRGGLGGVADRLRRQLSRSIAPGLAGERRAVLEGIVLGDDEALTDETRGDFRRSGLYHLLAVSGQNVVLVAGGVLLLAWLLGIPRMLAELGALAAIAGYVLAVGAQPSVVRAGIAGAVASLAWLSGRIRDAWYVLELGAIALLAWNPYLVFDAGFQLSFAAVGAIFMLAPRIVRRLEGYPLPQKVREGIGISAACGIATAPILWLQFGALPVLAIAANLLAEPAIAPLLALAFVTAGLAALSAPSAALLATVNGWIAAYVAACAHAVGALPFAQVRTGRALAAVVALGAAAYAWRRWRTPSNRPT